MADVVRALAGAVGAAHVLAGDAVPDDYGRDESLGVAATRPLAVVRPADTAQVAAVLRIAGEHSVPVTARGSGTGLSGAAVPCPGGLVVSFERMNRIIDIDTAGQIAVVQPGVTLNELDRATAETGLVYPVFPGEGGASIGGTVATNAGGMHAVKDGVTRRHVTGLEVVLANGDILRTGGRYVKRSTGYDLTQLIVGSEGTLALVTEVTLRLRPRLAHMAGVLAPFPDLPGVTAAVPGLVRFDPLVLEYVDVLAMGAITANAGVDLGVPADVRERAQAYLLVVLENASADRLAEDVEALARRLSGTADVYMLEDDALRRLVSAREKAFWAARNAGANAIVDAVVPRAVLADYFAAVHRLAEKSGTLLSGCGHVGDGNVHLSVFQPDADALRAVMDGILRAAVALGGTISGEHGVGREKAAHFLALEDQAGIRLMRGIKQAIDPDGILNPGVLFG
ncbi:FAD-binding oxidoreductase [Spirillospora albida]|uniref:FAD-binding oxidoreductase n=1 Tax=Spirillospora albida TaxID=58123 RepID=UPI0004BE7B35|nr:FAD-linked oxidase C-terminal domain-containing protein [Spirillospora albida]